MASPVHALRGPRSLILLSELSGIKAKLLTHLSSQPASYVESCVQRAACHSRHQSMYKFSERTCDRTQLSQSIAAIPRGSETSREHSGSLPPDLSLHISWSAPERAAERAQPWALWRLRPH